LRSIYKLPESNLNFKEDPSLIRLILRLGTALKYIYKLPKGNLNFKEDPVLYFLHQFASESIVFNLFRYITFRAAAAAVCAFLFSLLWGPRLIQDLKALKAIANNQREHAESIHHLYADKKNIPTMGGVLIVLSVLFSTLFWANLTNLYVWLLIAVLIGFGFVGFLDDWLKLRYQNSKGLHGRLKLLGQILTGLLVAWVLYHSDTFGRMLYFPFLKQPILNLGILFIPFVIFVLVGTSNALNLTDGLDGLAIGCAFFTASTFAVLAYVTGRQDFTAYLSIPYLPGAGEITVFCAALAGACAGFLWYNAYPCQIMMGDTGSLSLGGVIGTVAGLLEKEFVLAIVGGIFVWEALSVIIQVTGFKLTGKRVFLMSPFHHHLQKLGWPENKIVIRFWIIAFMLAIVGLATLKVR